MGFTLGTTSIHNKPKTQQVKKPIDNRPDVKVLPEGRQSTPNIQHQSLDVLGERYATVKPSFLTEVIPLIRALAYSNADVSQALQNIVSLGNTGHKIFFDHSVKEKLVDQMRDHLENRRKLWAPGQAGMDGLVNKMFSQLLIGGALSSEVVVNPQITGLENILLINPEDIVFKLSADKLRYIPFQKVHNAILPGLEKLDGELIPLNQNTYRYFALNGDEEIPYGIPPYMPVLPRIESQQRMNTNIDFIMDLMGLIGFLEVLIDKPEEEEESERQYTARLENLLTQAKERVMGGLKDGVVVGFKEDHEFDLKTPAANYDQVVELYKNNELQIATALKQDASLWGRDYGTSESKANITFMKMLSELKNIQNIIRHYLEYIYELELRLAGFEFDFIKVKFRRSTLQDDYKYQQAEELKIKNTLNKLAMGMINQEQAADELDYENPAFPTTKIPLEMLIGKSGPGSASKPQDTRKKQKGASAKKSRAKEKPVNKITP